MPEEATDLWWWATIKRVVGAALVASLLVLAFGASLWLLWTCLGVAVALGRRGWKFLVSTLRPERP